MLCALKDVAAAFKGRPFKMICQEDWFVKQEQHNNRDGSNDSNSSHLRDHFLCAKYRILYALYQLSLTISLRGRFYCYPFYKWETMLRDDRETNWNPDIFYSISCALHHCDIIFLLSTGSWLAHYLDLVLSAPVLEWKHELLLWGDYPTKDYTLYCF